MKTPALPLILAIALVAMLSLTACSSSTPANTATQQQAQTPTGSSAAPGTPSPSTGGMMQGSSTGSGASGQGTMGGSGMMASDVTSAQLAQHNTPSDCWVAYQGRVYDMTSWIPQHPGGPYRIIPYCGTSSQFAAALQAKHGSRMDQLIKQVATDEGPFAG